MAAHSRIAASRLILGLSLSAGRETEARAERTLVRAHRDLSKSQASANRLRVLQGARPSISSEGQLLLARFKAIKLDTWCNLRPPLTPQRFAGLISFFHRAPPQRESEPLLVRRMMNSCRTSSGFVKISLIKQCSSLIECK